MGREAPGSHAVFTPRVSERPLEPTPGSQPVLVWDGPGIRAADHAYIADPMHPSFVVDDEGRLPNFLTAGFVWSLILRTFLVWREYRDAKEGF
jgi:hypothetical protein